MSANQGAVTVIDERVLTTYPQLNKPAYTAVVTYKSDAPVPRTLFLLLSDTAPGHEKELLEQIFNKKGGLYDQYLKFRAKKIKDDMTGAGAFTPQNVRF